MAKKKKTAAPVEELQGEMDLQKMIGANENKYLMINLVAKRAYDLKRGARSLVDLSEAHTPAELAVAEAVAGSLKVLKKAKEQKVVNLVETE